MVFQMLFSQKSESSYHLDRSRTISQFLKIKGSHPSLCVDGMQSIICILENCYLAVRHRPFRVKMTQEPDGIASRAQPAVAAPAGRPNGRLELELVAAFKKQSLLPPWIDSSCLWSDSTKACMQFSGRRRLCRRELVVATAGGGGSRVVCGLPITACLCGGGNASICSSFPSRQAPRSSWPLEFGSEVGDSSILIDCLGRKPRKFVAPRLGLLPQCQALLPLGALRAAHGRL